MGEHHVVNMHMVQGEPRIKQGWGWGLEVGFACVLVSFHYCGKTLKKLNKALKE